MVIQGTADVIVARKADLQLANHDWKKLQVHLPSGAQRKVPIRDRTFLPVDQRISRETFRAQRRELIASTDLNDHDFLQGFRGRRKNSPRRRLGNRARLQSCREYSKMNAGFSP
jgi:uncharacterized membrane-anchored protein YhcB (DUF1043 family)